MRLLLDSHVLLWAFADRNHLTVRARTLIEDDSNELFISIASIWELSTKRTAGRLDWPGSSTAALVDQVRQNGIQLVPLHLAHILRAETLPLHHGDPYDRIIVAQAIEEDLILISADDQMPYYASKLIWR